jgi:hypothetical protein
MKRRKGCSAYIGEGLEENNYLVEMYCPVTKWTRQYINKASLRLNRCQIGNLR